MQAALVNQHRHLASLPCASVSVTLLLKFLQERLAVAWAFRWLRSKSMMSRRLSQSDTALHGVEPGTLAKCQNPAQLKLWAPFHEASEAREAHAAWNKFQAFLGNPAAGWQRVGEALRGGEVELVQSEVHTCTEDGFADR